MLKVDGVLNASVNLATETARVRVTGGVPADALIKALDAAGYKAMRHVPAAGVGSKNQLVSATSSKKNNEGLRVAIAAALSLPLVVPMIAELFGIHIMLPGWIQPWDVN